MALSGPPLERLIRKGGAERVSKAAARELATLMEEYAVEIAKKALEYAYEDNRKTVRREDIRRAIKALT